MVVVGEAFFEGFFRGIARAGQVKALNSFNFDVFGYIKALALNTMKFYVFAQAVGGWVVNTKPSQEFCSR